MWQLLHVSAPPNCRCGAANQFGGRQPQPSPPASALLQHTRACLTTGGGEEGRIIVMLRALENVDIKILLFYHVGGVCWACREGGGWTTGASYTLPGGYILPQQSHHHHHHRHYHHYHYYYYHHHYDHHYHYQHCHKHKDCSSTELTIKSGHYTALVEILLSSLYNADQTVNDPIWWYHRGIPGLQLHTILYIITHYYNNIHYNIHNSQVIISSSAPVDRWICVWNRLNNFIY